MGCISEDIGYLWRQRKFIKEKNISSSSFGMGNGAHGGARRSQAVADCNWQTCKLLIIHFLTELNHLGPCYFFLFCYTWPSGLGVWKSLYADSAVWRKLCKWFNSARNGNSIGRTYFKRKFLIICSWSLGVKRIMILNIYQTKNSYFSHRIINGFPRI